jgi:hypothetical protein
MAITVYGTSALVVGAGLIGAARRRSSRTGHADQRDMSRGEKATTATGPSIRAIKEM